MKLSIIGTGGVGGYFGGRLAQAGNDVTFIARGEHLKAIQKSGLIVKSHLGDFTINPANATDKIESVAIADMVIICTKAWQVKEIAQTIAPLLSEETIVMPLQNGVLAADELAEFIPTKNIVGGLCRIFSKIESPAFEVVAAPIFTLLLVQTSIWADALLINVAISNKIGITYT